MARTGYDTRINTEKTLQNKISDISDHKAFFSDVVVFWAPPNPKVVGAVLPPAAAGLVEAAKSPPGFADPKPKSGGGAADPSDFCSLEVGLLLLVWNLKAVGAPNMGVDVAPEPEGAALGKPPNPLNAGIAGLSPSFFSVNEAPPNVGAPNPVNLGAPVAPPAKPLKPPVEGFVAPDEPAALFKSEPIVEPELSAPKPLKGPLAFGCSVATEVVPAPCALAEPPKNPPFRFGGVATVCVSVEVEAEVAALAEGPKNPPFLLFGGSAGVGAGAGAGAAAAAAPLIENPPPNMVGGADPSDVAFAEAGTSFPSPAGGVGLECSAFPLAGAGTEELLRALNARTCLPNGPSVLKLGAGLGRGRVIPGKAGLGGSAGCVVAGAVAVAVEATGVVGAAPNRLDGVGCDD